MKSLTPAALFALVADSVQPAIQAAVQEKHRKALEGQNAHVRRLLETAAVEGQYELSTNLILAPETVDALREDGFKVRCEFGCHVISWESLRGKTSKTTLGIGLTPKQQRLMELIWDSEDHAKAKTDVFARARENVWANPIRGAFGTGAGVVMRSLVKKGLVETSGKGRGYACCLTIEGAIALGKNA